MRPSPPLVACHPCAANAPIANDDHCVVIAQFAGDFFETS